MCCYTHIPSQPQRFFHRIHCSTFFPAFGHSNQFGQCCNNTITWTKIPDSHYTYLTLGKYKSAFIQNTLKKGSVLGRIYTIESGSNHRHRITTGIQTPFVSSRIASACQSAYHHAWFMTGITRTIHTSQVTGCNQSCIRGITRTNHRYSPRSIQQLPITHPMQQ